jgi:hypothetical protein
MILLREYNTTNKMKLKRKERKYMEKLGATLNCMIPTRTNSEYCQKYRNDHKEQLKEYKKHYYEANKQAIHEKHKQYRETNKEKVNQTKKEKIECECGCVVIRNHMARHKKTQKHKDLMDEQ